VRLGRPDRLLLTEWQPRAGELAPGSAMYRSSESRGGSALSASRSIRCAGIMLAPNTIVCR
jgi:hypothetical protein